MKPFTIAVFGSSEPRPGEPAYETARAVGSGLARAGCVVLTGGYGGVMAAASEGARAGGGRTVGVTCAVFAARTPNPWLDEIVATDDLHARTQVLIERADGFVVLPGRAGTLAEIGLLWALHRAGRLGDRPVVLAGSPWRPLLQYLHEGGWLDRSESTMAELADSPARAVALVCARLPRRQEPA